MYSMCSVEIKTLRSQGVKGGIYIIYIMLRARAYTRVFQEKICQSATDGLYRAEVQKNMRVADLWQIVENVADCGRFGGAGTVSFRHHPITREST